MPCLERSASRVSPLFWVVLPLRYWLWCWAPDPYLFVCVMVLPSCGFVRFLQFICLVRLPCDYVRILQLICLVLLPCGYVRILQLIIICADLRHRGDNYFEGQKRLLLWRQVFRQLVLLSRRRASPGEGVFQTYDPVQSNKIYRK
jgi:hypothetical protein